jgi:hypothetical protein
VHWNADLAVVVLTAAGAFAGAAFSRGARCARRPRGGCAHDRRRARA